MKVLKVSLLVLGGIALVIGISVLFMTVVVDIKVLYEIATRYSTSSDLKDPRQSVLVIAGLAALGGLLIGMGIGLPTRRYPSDDALDVLVEQRIKQNLDLDGSDSPDEVDPPKP